MPLCRPLSELHQPIIACATRLNLVINLASQLWLAHLIEKYQ